jgi:3-oxoadipate CoA-transferase beta subunit
MASSVAGDRIEPTSGALGRDQLARWVADAIPDGVYVNLGIGLPTLVANHLDAARQISLHSENGILGFGGPPPEGNEDPDLIDAGKRAVTLLPGGSFFDQSLSFAMIRGGHIDLSIIGAYQVSERGDFANWLRPDDPYGSVGGAMDLAVGARQTWVVMPLLDRDGRPKLVRECTYALTGIETVDRVFTDHGLFDRSDGLLRLSECVPGISVNDVSRIVPWATGRA